MKTLKKFFLILVIALSILSCDQKSNINDTEQITNSKVKFSESTAMFQSFLQTEDDLKTSGDTIEVILQMEVVDFENQVMMTEMFIDGIQYSDDGQYNDLVAGDGIFSSIESHQLIISSQKNLKKEMVIVHKGSAFKFEQELNSFIQNQFDTDKEPLITIGCDFDIVECTETSWWNTCWPFSSPCNCVEFTDCHVEINIL